MNNKEYDVDFDLVLHIRGGLTGLDHKPEDPAELLDDIFPGDCECEFLGVSTSLNSSFHGYMEVTEVEDDDDDDEDDDDEED